MALKNYIALFTLFIFFPGFSQSPENYTREWGTYFGGSDINWLFLNIKVDDYGNIWAIGTVDTDAANADFDNMITQGAHQNTGAGEADIFIIKFSPDGSDLLYASYFGGERKEFIYNIDIKGNKVYIAGYTTSETGIATLGSYQGELVQIIDPNGNPYDFPRAAFIAQFDLNGQLQWSTYYQGDRVTGTDWGDMKAGNDDDVYLWIQTQSSNLGTPGVFKETIPPPYNNSGNMIAPYYPVLVRFDDTGQLLWATYCSPDIISSSDQGGVPDGGLAIDSQNNVYVCGKADGSYYGTLGAHQPISGGQSDIFFSKFSSSGQRLWSTYYGGARSGRRF